jgi:hypothetical protein
MKTLFAGLVLTLSALNAGAAMTPQLDVTSCQEDSIDLTSVVEMRSFGRGSINVFKTDRVEPAAGAVGLAIVVHRGDDLENAESFCRHVGGISDVDLQSAKSAYDARSNTLTLVAKANMMDENGEFPARVLTIQIEKGARESNLVKASIR